MAGKPRIVVVGSANMDLVVRCLKIAAPGETVLGGQFMTAPGGKGANQAVAAARMGGDVSFVGRIGQDTFGDRLAQALAEDGIHTEFLRRDPQQPTGVALISVDAQGQNAITVAPGANHQVSPEDVAGAREPIAQADVVIIQLEIPLETVTFAIEFARSLNTRVLLNPAPARYDDPLPAYLLRKVDVLTPNAREAANLLGHENGDGLDMADMAQQLHDIGGGQVVVTLGEHGCLMATEGGVQRIPAQPVIPVDTTAAGDCFTGGLAVGLGEGRSLREAVDFAMRAAAIAVTRTGAQPSLPMRSQLVTH